MDDFKKEIDKKKATGMLVKLTKEEEEEILQLSEYGQVGDLNINKHKTHK